MCQPMPGSHRTQPGRVMNRILETENSGKCLSYFLELWMIFFQVSVNLTPNVSIYIFSFIHNFSDESFFPTGSLLCTLPPPDTASQDHIRCLDAGWRMRSVQNPVIVVILDNINPSRMRLILWFCPQGMIQKEQISCETMG